jgi:hypothetical protein
MKIGWIALGIVLVALVVGLGEAKDYVERIGQYEVNFTLPDDTAANTKLNKTTMSGEGLDGTPYHIYSIELQIPEADQYWGFLWITHLDRTYKMDLAAAAKNVEGLCRADGYNAANSAYRTIDGRQGYIVQCMGSEIYKDDYRFQYQLDDKTTVTARLILDWEKEVLPLLKSLHVKEVPTS